MTPDRPAALRPHRHLGNRRHPWLLVIGLLLWLGLSATALCQTGDLILQRAFWQDRGAQATFEEARQQHHTPYRGILSRGYSDSVHWIRLTIAASEQPLGLRITPVWLDRSDQA